jgi:hypothetical protein
MRLAEVLYRTSTSELSTDDVSELSALLANDGVSGVLRMVEEMKLLGNISGSPYRKGAINKCYNLMLRRDVDSAGLEFYENALARDEMDIMDVLYHLTLSDEFRDIAFTHIMVAEAATKLVMLLLTGKEPSHTVVSFLGAKMKERSDMG